MAWADVGQDSPRKLTLFGKLLSCGNFHFRSFQFFFKLCEGFMVLTVKIEYL